MGLQVRLVHALADQLLELEPHANGKPLIVGRAPEADVHVPSLNVSRKHVILYQKGEGWVMQDTGGERGTFLNGKPITGAVRISSGDTITLGSDPVPVTLVIDPYGASAAHEPTVAAAAPPTVVRQEAPPSASRLPQPSAPRNQPPSTPIYAPAAATYDVSDDSIDPTGAMAGEEGVAAGGGDDWMSPEAISPTAMRVIKKKARAKQSMSPVTMGVTVVLVIAILGGAYWGYRWKTAQQAAAAAIADKATAEASKAAPSQRPKSTGSIFADTEQQRQFEEAQKRAGGDKKAGGKPTASVPVDPAMADPSPSAASESPKVAVNFAPEFTGGKSATGAGSSNDPPPMKEDDLGKSAPTGGDPDWARIEEAHGISPPIEAVVIYQDYANQFPQSPHAATLKKYTDEAMDLIWWNRISELAQKRDSIKRDLLKKDTEIAAETSAEFKKTLEAEKVQLGVDMGQVEDKLKGMNFGGSEPPPLTDAAAMTILRKTRDGELYGKWLEKTLRKIKTTRGAKIW